MSISEFLKLLEIPIREGQNALALPLFDERHARRVLVAYGRAFERLPATADGEGARLSSQQRRFVRDAVKSLAVNDKVICVHLSVFSQIARDREWTASELHRLGGLQGVGVRFLDDLFGSVAGARPRHHEKEDQVVRSVFRQLLPRSLTGIKGTSMTRQQLWEGLPEKVPRPVFDRVIERLESEFRLISPVDDLQLDGQEQASGGAFRLTHDFLVAPIRDWLERRQKETRRGRVEQRLSDLGEAWNATHDNCYLPGVMEFASFFVFGSRSVRSRFRSFLIAASRRKLAVLAVVAAALASVAGLVAFLVNDGLNRTAARHVENFLISPPEQTSHFAELLTPWRSRARSLLQNEIESETPTRRLRASAFLIDTYGNLPDYSRALLDALRDAPLHEITGLTETLERLEERQMDELVRWAAAIPDENRRVHFALLLANVGDSRVAREVLDRRNTYGRSQFIQSFPEFPWRAETMMNAIKRTSASDFRSGILLAMGRFLANKQDRASRDPLAGEMQEIFNSLQSIHGVRSAAEYALRATGHEPQFREGESRQDEGWKALELPNGEFTTFVRIPGGTFNPVEGLTDELIARERIAPRFLMESGDIPVNTFYLCTVPVSRSLFAHFVATLADEHPLAKSEFASELAGPVQTGIPATGVDWLHAVEFCNWMSNWYGLPEYYRLVPVPETFQEVWQRQVDKFGIQAPHDSNWYEPVSRDGPGFRLPYSIEWNFAYRGGSKTVSPFTDNLDRPFWSTYTWHRHDMVGNRGFGHVYGKLPNQFGFFDMSGNTSQWCTDRNGMFTLRLGGNYWDPSCEKMLPGVTGETVLGEVLSFESIRLAVTPANDGFFPAGNKDNDVTAPGSMP